MLRPYSVPTVTGGVFMTQTSSVMTSASGDRAVMLRAGWHSTGKTPSQARVLGRSPDGLGLWFDAERFELRGEPFGALALLLSALALLLSALALLLSALALLLGALAFSLRPLVLLFHWRGTPRTANQSGRLCQRG